MSRTLNTLQVAGSPSASSFVTQADALLATLPGQVIVGFHLTLTDKLPAYTRSYKLALEVVSGGVVAASPFQVKVFEAPDDVSARGLVAAFETANPTYFVAPAIYLFSDQLPNIPLRSVFAVVYCTDAAAGANWQPGAGGTGGGGGGSAYVLVNQGGQEMVKTVPASGAALTIDLADGNVHDVTLTAACTFTLTPPLAGKCCSLMLVLRQGGLGGWTVAWPASVKWPLAIPPGLTATAGAVDVVMLFTVDGGVTWLGNPGLFNLL
jgi:hypothetical protein